LKRLLFVFFSLFVMLHAEAVVHITSSDTTLEDFTMNYYVDHSENLSFADIQKVKFTESGNRLSLGIHSHVTWVKIILQNDTASLKELYIQNTYAYHAAASTYYECDTSHKLLRHISFKPRKYINVEKMDGAVGSFKVRIKPNETKIIYMKSYFLAYQLITLKIFDNKHAKANLINQYMLIIILTTILLTLAGYYSMLYFISRHKEYIYYSLYLVSSAIFIAYSYGMLSHYFHVFGKLSLYLNASILLSPVFLTQFVKTIFNTEENHKKENRFLNSIIVIFTVAYLYSFMDYYRAIELASFLYIYLLIIMMAVGISLYIKSVPLIKYFLWAHIFYIVFSMVAVLFYNNLIPFNYFTSHAIAFGTLIEALLLAFLVSYRIRLLEESDQKKAKILLTDMMTKLYNKSYFEEFLAKELEKHREEKNVLGLVVIDIDYFKQYNDTYGHIAGDKALLSVAEVLKEISSHHDDMAFRIGGEEFALICNAVSRKRILNCAQSLKNSIENLKIRHEKSDINPYLTISLGVYFASNKIIEDAQKVFAYADKALYSAKSQGRNQVFVYENMERKF